MARTALLAFAIFVGLGALSFIGGTVLPASDGLRYGFPAYYTSSRLVLEREWGPDVYDDAWFSDRSKDLTGGTVAEIYRPNTPMMSLLALPIAWLDVFKARRVWLLADLLLIATTMVALLAALPALRSPLRAAVLVGLCLWWAPLRETVSLGQAYALMLALQAVALWAVVRDRRGITGLAIGAAVATKLAAVPLLLVLAVRGSWRSVVVAGVTVLGLAVATVGFAHVDSWSRFSQVLVEDALRPPPSQSVTAYQSASSFFAHLFTADALWNPGPIADLPWLASVLGVMATAIALVATVWLGRRGRADTAVAAAVAAGVLVLGLAQEYHFAMLLVPAAVALARWFDAPGRPASDGLWLAVALALLAAPLPYQDPRLTVGWAALLAYPRLYGAWLLWGWLGRELWMDRSFETVAHGRAVRR
jgi:hypothetical protein